MTEDEEHEARGAMLHRGLVEKNHADGMIRSIRVVPNCDPDSEGRWINLPEPVEGRCSWNTTMLRVAEFVPVDHFLVAVCWDEQ